ncbi:hypothetical protein PH210_12380 [Paenibacillus sp. BSR1-1]|uniref:hypothetical protein n=1 Tax=Paenibacillus sp. BSR1-1 TaxID=3020845 RepID=UPI0025AFBD4F|nr:hypothetical protein [Paenibacillus sp. BSR1-1]MDN3016988.1 hypothetical protein [Paenibacillus sp. BSR1-1]
MLKTSQFNFIGGINVQTMQRQSGIFIGENNNAIGWSAHGKENYVIGNISGQSNFLYQNTSILLDPDLVDTPIDDRDINLSFDFPGEENQASSINLDSINVNTQLDNSSVFVGKGHVTGMDANQKANYSQGSLFGNSNQLLNNFNLNYDQDTIDALIEDQDIKISNIMKE